MKFGQKKNLTNVGSNAAQRQPSRLQGVANILQNIASAKESSKIVDEIYISRHVDPLTGEVMPDEYQVYTYNGGREVINEASGVMNAEKMQEVFGKDLGGRMVEAAEAEKGDGQAEISGGDLRIGGEGMKGFYDKMLPSFVQKYVKKWGAKVGEVELPELEEGAQKMWSVDVTPEMKESVMEGQVMFREITDPAIQRAVDKFAARYNAAPVEELPSEREEMIAFAMEDGYSREEAEELYEEFKNIKASYISVDDKIYIFAGRVSQNTLNFIDYDGRRKKNSTSTEAGAEDAVLAEPRDIGMSDSRRKNGRRNQSMDTRQAGVAQSDDGRYPGRENLILDEIVRLEAELNTAVEAIDSFDALPEGKAKDAIAEGRKVLGWYQDGRVYVKFAMKHENAHASMSKLFPEGRRDAEFDVLYEGFKNNVVGGYVHEIDSKYKDYSERKKKEELIAFGVEIIDEQRILDSLKGEAKDLYNEILTNNKKENGSTDRRRVEGNQEDGNRRPDRRRTGDIQELSGPTEESRRLYPEAEQGRASHVGRRVGSLSERVLDEIVRLEAEGF